MQLQIAFYYFILIIKVKSFFVVITPVAPLLLIVEILNKSKYFRLTNPISLSAQHNLKNACSGKF